MVSGVLHTSLVCGAYVKGTKGLKCRCNGWIILGGAVCDKEVVACTVRFGSTGSNMLCVLVISLLIYNTCSIALIPLMKQISIVVISLCVLNCKKG